jgi:hypothetical protein
MAELGPEQLQDLMKALDKDADGKIGTALAEILRHNLLQTSRSSAMA